MPNLASERSQTVLQEISSTPEQATAVPGSRRSRRIPGLGGLAFAIVLASFWIGAASAYLFGYLGLGRLANLDTQTVALFVAIVVVPPMLFVAGAWALARGQALSNTVGIFGAQVDRLFAADEVSARTAARLGRTVRGEIDALNAGIDTAFARLRALESVLQNQIAALDEAGARADVRGEAIANRLIGEREKLEAVGQSLVDAASRSGEIITEHSGQFRATVESASSALDEAAGRSGDTLKAGAAQLREKIEAAETTLVSSASIADQVLADRAAQLRDAVEQASQILGEGASGADALISARTEQLRETLGSVGSELIEGATKAEKLIAKRAEELREVIVSASQSMVDGVASADAIAAQHAESLKATIISAGTSLASGADQAEARFAKRTEELRAIIATSGEVFIANTQQAEALLAKRTESLTQAAAAAGDTILAGASRVGDLLAERTGKLQSSIRAAEHSLGDKISHAEEALSNRAAALGGTLASAEASLVQATVAAGEQLSGHATRLGAHIELAGNGLTQSAERASESIGAHAAQWKTSIEGAENSLLSVAGRASEILAGRAAQLKTMIEAVDGTLRAAGSSLDTQAANFRTAAAVASEAPHKTAIQLDEQVKKIEAVVDTAMARTEFVLGRQERHRGAMNELLQKLNDEGVAFDTAVSSQRDAMEKVVASLGPETKKFETLASDTERHLELIMSNVAVRAANIADSMARDASRLKETSDSAAITLVKLTESLREAGASAHMLVSETAVEAKANANALVGEAMVECEKLIRAAGELSAQSGEVRNVLGETVNQIRTHLASLPVIAQQEAQRVRNMVRDETDEMLDLSARMITTIHSRTSSRANGRNVETEVFGDEAGNEGLLTRARRLTQRAKRRPADEQKPQKGNGKSWEMSALLAAAGSEDQSSRREFKSEDASALGALEASLSDMAMDLSAFESGPGPGEEDWRRYLAGDRTVFARRLADSIDSDAVNRITNLYREHTPFRQAADKYIGEFEALLEKAREGDGNGLLTSTMLGADTGKIYLALSYGLGRLS